LHELAQRLPERVEIETVDITIPEQIGPLHDRLAARKFDMLFVNAGVTNNPNETIADVTTEEFIRVMVTRHRVRSTVRARAGSGVINRLSRP
jgi:NAD(P)-dependent dehydrogenase (short-subunit alcohol dehydrogenase family)